MDWAEICIHTSQEAVDIISNILYEAGTNGVVIEDQHDLETLWDTSFGEIYELNPEDYPQYGVHVKGYLPVDEHLEKKLNAIRAAIDQLHGFDIDFGEKTIKVTKMNDEDWSSAWKRYYKPVHVSNRMTIVPTWENYTRRNEDEIVIALDPGMAFGTGTHATTILCLQALEKYLKKGSHVIDVGTGTGILSIAAAKLGAKQVHAYDLDPVAVRAAKANADLNGVSSLIKVRLGNLLERARGQADLIAANLLAPLIMQMVQDVPKKLKPSGRLIASGIIARQVQQVNDCMESAGLFVEEVMEQEDWAAIIAKHKEGA